MTNRQHLLFHIPKWIIQSNRFEHGWLKAQHSFSTRFPVEVAKQVAHICCPFNCQGKKIKAYMSQNPERLEFNPVSLA